MPDEAAENPELEVPTPETEIDEFKPTSEDLAVREPDDVYRAMDRADEILILDEIQGRALEVLVYDFKPSGKPRQVDLSVLGVNECIRLLNERGGAMVRVSSQKPVVEEFQEEGDSYYRVMIYAEDARGGGSRGHWGTATEPKHMKKRDGSLVWDKFALTKALNKAERNALKKHVPEEIRQTIIAMARNEGKVRELKSAAAGSVAELPPPLTDKKATDLKNEIRAAYTELKEINRMVLPPARFHAMLMRSEHEHARLEEMLGYVQGLVEKARADDDNTFEGTAEESS